MGAHLISDSPYEPHLIPLLLKHVLSGLFSIHLTYSSPVAFTYKGGPMRRTSKPASRTESQLL